MSTHKWKIGDWMQFGDSRYLVYREDGVIHAVNISGMTIKFEPHWLDAVYLPDCDGWDWQPSDIVREVPKPEPVHQPFASGEEFEPHRDKWLLEKCGDEETRRFRIQVAAYNDAGIWLGGAQIATKYATAFSLFAFEDGEPFGVEVAK